MSIDKFGRHLSRKQSSSYQQEIEEMQHLFQNYIQLALKADNQHILPKNIDLTNKEQWKLMTSPNLFPDKFTSHKAFVNWYENNFI